MSPAKPGKRKTVEKAAPTRRTFYYHGSAVALPEGRTLRASGGALGKGRAEAERLFERLRPRDKPSRLNAWFLGKTPQDLGALGASSLAHVYQVIADGPLHRGDFEWLWKAGTYEMGARYGVNVDGSVGPPHWNELDERIVADLIAKYWSGASSGEKARFEYHTPTITIIKRIAP